MQEIDVKWGDKALTYLGRNGTGKMEGISIYGIGNTVRIWPINSKGGIARCNMEIQKEAIPEVIKALLEAIKE